MIMKEKMQEKKVTEESCCMQFAHLSIAEFLNKSKMSHGRKQVLLNKARSKDDFVEFHADSSDMLLEIVQDWRLKRGTSIRKTLHSRLASCLDKMRVFIFHILSKTIVEVSKIAHHRTTKQKAWVSW